jgi:hypothetical protein
MDACCGPHTGTEDLSAYISNAIDPSRPITASRTTTRYQGITNVNNASSYAVALPDHIMETVDQAMAKGLVSATPETGFSNANWDALQPLLADWFSIRQMQRSIDIGDFGSEVNYIFRHDDGGLCTLGGGSSRSRKRVHDQPKGKEPPTHASSTAFVNKGEY